MKLEPPLRPSRLQVGLWLLVMAAMIAIIVADFDTQAPMGSDGSHYVVLAESLFRGDAFGLISRPATPGGYWGKPSPFPWGYPLLLAPLASIFPGQFDLLRLPSLLATILNGAILFWGWPLLSRRSYGWGLAITALTCLSPLTISLAHRVFSEAVFTTFLLAGIVLLAHGVGQPPGKRPAWWWSPLTGGVLTMMVFTRVAGWAMLAGLGLFVLLSQRRAGVRPLAMVAVWMAAWTALVVSLTSVSPQNLVPVSYGRQFQDIIAGPNRAATDQGLPYAQVLLNLAGRRLHRDIPSVIAPGLASQYTQVMLARWGAAHWLPWLGWAISLVLILGFLRWQRKEGATAFLLAAALYLLLLMAWRVLGPRLLYPVQPQLFYALLLGGEGLLAALGSIFGALRRPQVRQRIVAAAAVALVVIYAGISFLAPGDENHAQALADRGRWFLTHTPDAAILMSLEPEMDYLYSRRQGLPYPEDLDAYSPADLAAYLSTAEVDYLVVEKQTGAWSLNDDAPQRSYRTNSRIDHLAELAQALQADGRLQRLYTGGGDFYRVYAVRR